MSFYTTKICYCFIHLFTFCPHVIIHELDYVYSSGSRNLSEGEGLWLAKLAAPCDGHRFFSSFNRVRGRRPPSPGSATADISVIWSLWFQETKGTVVSTFWSTCQSIQHNHNKNYNFMWYLKRNIGRNLH